MESKGNFTPQNITFYVFLFVLFLWFIYEKNIQNMWLNKNKRKNTLNLKAKFYHRIIVLIPFILTNCKVRGLSLDMAIILRKNTKA